MLDNGMSRMLLMFERFSGVLFVKTPITGVLLVKHSSHCLNKG